VKLNETAFAEKILFVGAHPDDIEIGCGGTAAKLVASGNVIAFAIATRDSDEAMAEKRKDEARRSAKLLRLSETTRTLFFGDLPDTQLNLRHGDLRQWLKTINKQFEPDTVFIHRPDLHTDHEALFRVATGVFEDADVFLFKIRRASPDTAFSPNYPIDVSGFIRKKLAMCRCHASQRPIYIGNDSVKTNAHQCYFDWYGKRDPRRNGYAEEFYIHAFRSSLDFASRPTRLVVPYSLRLVREADHTLHWRD
jgi:LmbE family N-acetylglucosaminyl deacetylase